MGEIDEIEVSESLLSIAESLRLECKYHLSWIVLSKVGGDLPRNLLIRYLYEVSITAFYVNEKDKGFRAADRLSLLRDIEWWRTESVLKNRSYYISKAPVLDCKELNIDTDKGWSSFNPSIIPYEDGYIGTIKCSNVAISDEGVYSRTEGDHFIYKNYLVRLDKEFNVLSSNLLSLNDEPIPSSYTEGVEDCRLFTHEGRIKLGCVYFGNHRYNKYQTSIADLNVEELSIDNVEHIRSLSRDIVNEKNWLFFEDGDKLKVLHNYEPFQLSYVEGDELEPLVEYTDESLNFSTLKGSAGPIVREDGLLFLLHDYVHLSGSVRTYNHRWVLLDSTTYEIRSISLPFYFLKVGIEFATTMFLEEGYIYVSIGVGDSESYVIKIDPSTITLEDVSLLKLNGVNSLCQSELTGRERRLNTQSKESMIFANNNSLLNYQRPHEDDKEFAFRTDYARVAVTVLDTTEDVALIMSSMALSQGLTGCSFPIEYQTGLDIMREYLNSN